MRKIYLLLMHTNTVPSKLVRLFTRFEYSHVAISLEKDCNTIYSFGRKKVNNILNGGFSVENKDGEFFSKFKDTKCKIYEITVTDKQYKDVKNMLMSMKKNEERYKYDFLGIVPRFFGIPLSFKDKFVCSYFVAYVLEKNNIYTFNKNTKLISPKDFEQVNGLGEIYIGKYLEYTV